MNENAYQQSRPLRAPEKVYHFCVRNGRREPQLEDEKEEALRHHTVKRPIFFMPPRQFPRFPGKNQGFTVA
jgi:hypothetical protein